MTEQQSEPTAPMPLEAEQEENSAQIAAVCCACDEQAAHACHRCGVDLCGAHAYSEEDVEHYFCRDCADTLVGVCGVCDALYARPCRECGLKVCEQHRVRIIHRWGWGGAPGQGGVVDWFPMMHTYCEQHGKGRRSIPRPKVRGFKGYDGSSPEW